MAGRITRGMSRQRHLVFVYGECGTITSTIRGVPSEVVLGKEDGMKEACAVNLHNTFTVSPGRLGKRVAKLQGWRMREICTALRFSLGCDVDG